jgi:hypothetical protein
MNRLEMLTSPEHLLQLQSATCLAYEQARVGYTFGDDDWAIQWQRIAASTSIGERILRHVEVP